MENTPLDPIPAVSSQASSTESGRPENLFKLPLSTQKEPEIKSLKSPSEESTEISENFSPQALSDQSLLQVTEAVQRLNQSVRHLSFEMEQNLNRVQIKVHDGQGELIREIPSDEFMRIAENVDKLQGKLFDDFF